MLSKKAFITLCALGATMISHTSQADTLVVLNKSEANASLIDLETGRTAATVPTGNGPHEVAVSPDGATAVVSNYGGSTAGTTLTVIDIASASVVRTIPLVNPSRPNSRFHRPHGIQWIPNTTDVVVTSEDDQALVRVDVVAGRVVTAIATEQDTSHMVVVTASGDKAFVANIDSGSATVIDLVRNVKITDIPTGAGAEGIDITPDGTEVWVTNNEADTISVIDVATLRVTATLRSASFPIRVKFTHDGSQALVTNASSSTFRIFDRATHAVVETLSLGGNSFPIGILVDPRRGIYYVAHENSDVISVIDPSDLSVRGQLRAGRGPDGMAYTSVVVR